MFDFIIIKKVPSKEKIEILDTHAETDTIKVPTPSLQNNFKLYLSTKNKALNLFVLHKVSAEEVIWILTRGNCIHQFENKAFRYATS